MTMPSGRPPGKLKRPPGKKRATIPASWPQSNICPARCCRKRMVILLAVLVPVGVIILTVAAWAYWLKRNGRLHRGQIWTCCLGAGKDAKQEDSEELGAVRSGKPELPADPPRPSRLENHPAKMVAHELHTEPIPIREADSRRVVPEVDATPLSLRPSELHPQPALVATEAVQRPRTR